MDVWSMQKNKLQALLTFKHWLLSVSFPLIKSGNSLICVFLVMVTKWENNMYSTNNALRFLLLVISTKNAVSIRIIRFLFAWYGHRMRAKMDILGLGGRGPGWGSTCTLILRLEISKLHTTSSYLHFLKCFKIVKSPEYLGNLSPTPTPTIIWHRSAGDLI